jgi:hypothetical protein
MKAQSWLKYFLYLLLIVLVVWVNGAATIAFQNDYGTTNKINYLLYSIVIMLPVLVGAVIGTEAFVNEMTRAGKWKLNLAKLILITIPSLYISTFYFIAMIPNETSYKILIAPVYKFFGNTTTFVVIFQIVLGYSLITLFNKVEVVKEAVSEENQGVEDYDTENSEDGDFVENSEYSQTVNQSEESETDVDEI